MPLHVAIDVRHLKDFGFGTYTRNLLRSLGQLDQQSRYTLVTAPADHGELKNLPENFSSIIYPGSDKDKSDHFRFPWFLINNVKADVYHIPLNQVPYFMPRPYVVTIHDMSSLIYHQGEGWRNTFRESVFKRGLERAERIVAVSMATRRDLENLVPVRPNQIRQVYNAIDPRFLDDAPVADARAGGPNMADFERRRVLERYQINYPFLLYAGNIRPQKNIPRLVEAFAVLRGDLEQHPQFKDLRLIIIGDEISKFPAVRRAVIQTRAEQVVRFLGFVPFDTLRVFYSAAQAFVFPSLYEGFGLPPLEAMASGTPVITSSVSSLPEVVGDAAMFVNPENVFDIARGIRDVLLNEPLRKSMIEKGHAQARTFSWQNTAEQVLAIYKEAAHQN